MNAASHGLIRGIQFKHYLYSNPTSLSYHVQPLLWLKCCLRLPIAPLNSQQQWETFCAFESAASWQYNIWSKTFDECLCNIALSLHSPIFGSLRQFILQSVIKFKISVLTLRGTSDLCPGYLIDQLKATNENQCQQCSSLLEQIILQLH